MNTPQETGGRKAVASQGGGWLRQAARLCMGRAMHPVAVADLRHEAPALPASRGATPLRGANPADASRSGALMTAPSLASARQCVAITPAHKVRALCCA